MTFDSYAKKDGSRKSEYGDYDEENCEILSDSIV